MTPVRWAPEALVGLQHQLDYFAAHSEASAEQLALRIETATTVLSTFPLSGRRLKKLRKFTVPRTHLLLIYRATEEAIEIVAFLDGRQNWQKRFRS